MDDYISRTALLKRIATQKCDVRTSTCKDCDIKTFCVYDVVETFPAADVAPVRHGEWERYEGYSKLNEWSVNFRCPVCRKFRFHNGELRRYKYCPECGAKMDGGSSYEWLD